MSDQMKDAVLTAYPDAVYSPVRGAILAGETVDGKFLYILSDFGLAEEDAWKEVASRLALTKQAEPEGTPQPTEEMPKALVSDEWLADFASGDEWLGIVKACRELQQWRAWAAATQAGQCVREEPRGNTCDVCLRGSRKTVGRGVWSERQAYLLHPFGIQRSQ